MVSELAATITCSDCQKRGILDAGIIRESPTARLLYGVSLAYDAIGDATRMVAQVQRKNARPMAIGRVRKLDTTARNARSYISEGLHGGGRYLASASSVASTRVTDPVTGNLCAGLLDELTDAVAAAHAATRSDERRAQLLEKVHRTLFPPDWTDDLPAMDETPMLIGVYPPFRRGDLVKELVPAFDIAGDDQKVVMVAPRFVYDYVQRVALPSSVSAQRRGRTLIQALPAPADDDVLQMAVVLWSPMDPGPLRDLAKAYEAAQTLAAVAQEPADLADIQAALEPLQS